MKSVLIVDDDADLCAMLQEYFSLHDLRLSVQCDGASGLRAAMENAFDLIILDIMLPVLDGLSLLRTLRTSSDIGIIMLSASAHEMDRVHGFEVGADDYISKPFNPVELLGRIRAVLRRTAHRRDFEPLSPLPAHPAAGLRLNSNTRQAFYNDRKLHLTEIEFLLLSTFLDSPGTIISREDLVQRVFQREFNPLDRSLDMHISRLRRKFDSVNCTTDLIRTVRSSGYFLSAN